MHMHTWASTCLIGSQANTARRQTISTTTIDSSPIMHWEGETTLKFCISCRGATIEWKERWSEERWTATKGLFLLVGEFWWSGLSNYLRISCVCVWMMNQGWQSDETRKISGGSSSTSGCTPILTELDQKNKTRRKGWRLVKSVKSIV